MGSRPLLVLGGRGALEAVFLGGTGGSLFFLQPSMYQAFRSVPSWKISLLSEPEWNIMEEVIEHKCVILP